MLALTAFSILDLNNDKTLKLQILSEYEADLIKGIISITSPLGRALLNKRLKDFVEFESPRGLMEYEVLGIS